VDVLSGLYYTLLKDSHDAHELLDMKLYSEFKEFVKLFKERMSGLAAQKMLTFSSLDDEPRGARSMSLEQHSEFESKLMEYLR
jgi:hypothetical protein